MPETILATMLATLTGLALGACAQPAEDQQDSQELTDESQRHHPDAAPESCADRGNFDLAVFVAEIFPILNGEIDLNDPDSGDVLTGCTRGPCHGQPRPEGLVLSATLTPEENLEAFACFVDLRKPRRSQVLVCPSSDDARCAVGPHPGSEIFDPPGDLNHDRVLDYIQDSRP